MNNSLSGLVFSGLIRWLVLVPPPVCQCAIGWFSLELMCFCFPKWNAHCQDVFISSSRCDCAGLWSGKWPQQLPLQWPGLDLLWLLPWPLWRRVSLHYFFWYAALQYVSCFFSFFFLLALQVPIKQRDPWLLDACVFKHYIYEEEKLYWSHNVEFCKRFFAVFCTWQLQMCIFFVEKNYIFSFPIQLVGKTEWKLLWQRGLSLLQLHVRVLHNICMLTFLRKPFVFLGSSAVDLWFSSARWRWRFR